MGLDWRVPAGFTCNWDTPYSIEASADSRNDSSRPEEQAKK